MRDDPRSRRHVRDASNARDVDEVLARIELTHRVLDAFAKRRGKSLDALDPSFVKAVRIACLELDVEAILVAREEPRERPRPLGNARRGRGSTG